MPTNEADFLSMSGIDQFMAMFRWCPASEDDLRAAEERLLSHVKAPHSLEHVAIGPTRSPSQASPWTFPSWGWDEVAEDYYINTLTVDRRQDRSASTSASASGAPIRSLAEASASEAQSLPHGGSSSMHHSGSMGNSNGDNRPTLVMLHGYASALGFYFRNFDALSEHFKVYAIDQLGWGCSSRPPFTPTNTEETEEWFVESLEAWRREMRLEKFILLGHSFGGYISCRYALKYPDHVIHLVLVGPAGFNHESERMRGFKNTIKGMAFNAIWETNTTPQSMLRLMGPWSRDVIKTTTVQRWGDLPPGQTQMGAQEVDAFTDYIYQTFVAPKSGEQCMRHLFSLGAFARRPLIESAMKWKAPTTFIYGADDIMDYRAGLAAAKQMPVPAEVFHLENVGHMLFLENPSLFHAAVIYGVRDLLPADSKAVAEAQTIAEMHRVPLDRCHRVVFDGSQADDDLIKLQGSSGIRRLGNGWGIG